MPLRGTNAAPKFNGTPARLIPFFEDIEQLVDYATLDFNLAVMQLNPDHWTTLRINSALAFTTEATMRTWITPEFISPNC
jgi:hypothetical protein